MVNNCFNFSLFVLCVKTAESFLSLKVPFVRVTVKKRLNPVVVRSGSRKKQVTIIILPQLCENFASAAFVFCEIYF